MQSLTFDEAIFKTMQIIDSYDYNHNNQDSNIKIPFGPEAGEDAIWISSKMIEAYLKVKNAFYDIDDHICINEIDYPCSFSIKNNKVLFEGATNYHIKGNYDEAIRIFLILSDIYEGQKEICLYNVACGYSRKKDMDNALKYLAMSIEAGYRSFDHMYMDSDLEFVRKDLRFNALVEDFVYCNNEKDNNDERDNNEFIYNNNEMINNEENNDVSSYYINKMKTGFLSMLDYWKPKANIDNDDIKLPHTSIRDSPVFSSAKVILMTQNVLRDFDGKNIRLPFGSEAGSKAIDLSCYIIEKFLKEKELEYLILESYPCQYQIINKEL